MWILGTQSDLPAVRPSDWADLPPQRTKAECRLVRTMIDMMFPTIPKDEIVVNPTPSTPYLNHLKAWSLAIFCLPPEGHKQLILLLLLLLLTFTFFKASAYSNLNFGIPYMFLVLLDTFENFLQFVFIILKFS